MTTTTTTTTTTGPNSEESRAERARWIEERDAAMNAGSVVTFFPTYQSGDSENVMTPNRLATIQSRERARKAIEEARQLRARQSAAGVLHPGDPAHVVADNVTRSSWVAGVLFADGSVHLFDRSAHMHSEYVASIGREPVQDGIKSGTNGWAFYLTGDGDVDPYYLPGDRESDVREVVATLWESMPGEYDPYGPDYANDDYDGYDDDGNCQCPDCVAERHPEDEDETDWDSVNAYMEEHEDVPADAPAIGSTATVLVGGVRYTGTVTWVRANGWVNVETVGGEVASGPIAPESPTEPARTLPTFRFIPDSETYGTSIVAHDMGEAVHVARARWNEDGVIYKVGDPNRAFRIGFPEPAQAPARGLPFYLADRAQGVNPERPQAPTHPWECPSCQWFNGRARTTCWHCHTSFAATVNA